MNYGICLIGIVAVRAEPSHRSQMVSQLLFGELYTVMEASQDWYRIHMNYDMYEGWIHRLQATLISEEEYLRLTEAYTPCTLDLVQAMVNETKKMAFPVVAGSSLPGIEEFHMRFNGESYRFDGQVSDIMEIEDAETHDDLLDVKQNLLTEALTYRHAPYLWGGRTPFGIDCSGLTQMVFKLKNIPLPRDASQQALQGETIALLDEAEPADIVFFDDEEGKIIHTGILIDRTHILHASGHVRVDLIDHHGIFNEKEETYTHKLRLIRRMF